MRNPARSLSAEPSVFSVGVSQVSVAAPACAAETAMLKGGSEAARLPSETEITMFAKVVTSPAAGVPLRRPLRESKVAQAGLFAIWYSSELPSGSDAVGWKA